MQRQDLGQGNLKITKAKNISLGGLKMIPDICLCDVLLKLKDSQPSVGNLS